MENLDLNAMGVVEMSVSDKVIVDGGVPQDWYMDDDTIDANGDLIAEHGVDVVSFLVDVLIMIG